MKMTIQIPDEIYDKLDAVAGSQDKKPNQFVAESIDFILKRNPRENQILLSGKNVSDIGMAVGGKTIRTGEEIVKMFQDNFRLSVAGVDFSLSTEDAHALKAQYEGMGFGAGISYEDYVKAIFKDALALYLWGSTTGTFAYR